MPITIATWNVNSIKTRLHQLLPWLENAKPDIVLLQELKCVDAAFPTLEIESLGYNIATHGQKTYNGVAILSKTPLDDVKKGLPTLAGGHRGEASDNETASPPFGHDSDPPPACNPSYITPTACGGGKGGAQQDANMPPLTSPPQAGGISDTDFINQARYIEATTNTSEGTFRIASIYVPNGQDETSDKFQFKLRFLEALDAHFQQLKTYGEMLVLGGDYNVALYDADVYNPASLYGSVCFHPEEQKRLRKIMHAGLLDAFRLAHPEHDGACPYTWWDYRGGGFEQNKGLRIDHLLLSPQAADKLKDCNITRDMRGQERPSDHVPVVASFG